MKKKIIQPAPIGFFFVAVIAIALGGIFLQQHSVEAAATNVVGLQMADTSSCSGGVGTARYATDVGTWMSWTGDSDNYDPDCVRLYLGNSIPKDLDIRIGIQSRDINTPCGFLWLSKCGDGGGTIVYGPWASESVNNWSGWACDRDCFDGDQWRLMVDTRPWYGTTVTDFKLGIQVGDVGDIWSGGGGCTEKIGITRYTASSTAGVGWTSWAADNDDNGDYNCTRINLITTNVLNDPTATLTGTSSVRFGNSINIPWDVQYINTTTGCTLTGRNGSNVVVDPARTFNVNGGGATTSIAITVPVTYTLFCNGFKAGTTVTATKTISPITQPAGLAFAMSPVSGLAAGSTSVATIYATNAASCTLVGKDTNGNVIDDGGSSYPFTPPIKSADSIEPANLSTNLVAYWSLDGGDTNWGGNTTNDRSGNGNTGSMVSMTSTASVSGKNDEAFSFGGTGYINAGSGATIDNIVNTNPTTIAFWINPSATNNLIMGKNDNNNTAGFFVENISSNPDSGSNGLRFVVVRSSTNMRAGVASPPNGTWTHVVIVYSGSLTASTQKIYYNGVQQTLTTSSNGSGTHVTDAAQTLYIANNYPASSDGVSFGKFSGQLDDIRIYTRALSAAEITQLYSATNINSSAATTYLSNTGQTTWVVPSDWTSSNTIEVIGGGAGGGGGGSRGGGGGGAYSKISNTSALSGGQTVTIKVGAGGTSNSSGGDTYLCSGTSNCASISGSAVVVGAKGGTTASGNSGGAGGQAASGVGATKNSGGNGNTGSSQGGAAGGGGAGGPNGAGRQGGSASDEGGGGGGNGGGGNGGTADSAGGCWLGCGGPGGSRYGGGGGGSYGNGSNGGTGSTGGGGGGGDDDGSSYRGGNGGNGVDLNGSIGGGGGGGGGGRNTGGNGGLYGGGGGGGGASTSGGTGGQGIIVINYNISGDTLADNTESHTSTHVVAQTTDYTVSCLGYDNVTVTKTVRVSVNGCSLNGITIANGGQANFYSQSVAPTGHTCSEYGPAVRTCSNGVLGAANSSYVYGACLDQSDITITANNISPSTSVRKGTKIALSWDGGNADSCTVTGTDGFSSTEISATMERTITQKTIYTASCTVGASTKSKTVTVNLIPSIIEQGQVQ